MVGNVVADASDEVPQYYFRELGREVCEY